MRIRQAFPAFLGLGLLVATACTHPTATADASPGASATTATTATATTATTTASATTTATAPSHPVAEEKGTGDLASARTLLHKFVDPAADKAALTRELKPTSADYASVFGENASAAQTYFDKMWSDKGLAISGNAGQTELIVFGSTTDAVVKTPGQFPGGYAKAKLKPGFPIYGFKFVEPGKTSGMAFDGLVFVNGHFAFFPKPWKATT